MDVNQRPVALVIGLCSHGLAMTRALHDEGIEVHAFEANERLPGYVTNSAHVHKVKNIKTESLIDDLMAFREQIPPGRDIVLFPTNDNNVSVIGRNIDKLTSKFLLSWEHCTDKVMSLLLKDNIEARCAETDILYPKSFVLREVAQLSEIEQSFEFPVIAKPVKPQSAFKAVKCATVEELTELVSGYASELPFLVQNWIEGTDRDIFFGALYLEHGKVVSEFCGNKLLSHPPARGQTTVAITCENREVIDITKRFFHGLDMSGPVSLELKRDPKGRYWAIEPTVGRTDFWVGLCVSAGCNLLAMEMASVCNTPYRVSNDVHPTIWFDSERDITAFVRHAHDWIPGFKKARHPAFSYLRRDDLRPFGRAMRKAAISVSGSVSNKLSGKNSNGATQPYEFHEWAHVEQLPDKFRQALQEAEQENVFYGFDWFKHFEKYVASKEGRITYIGVTDKAGNVLAIVPLWSDSHLEYGVKIRSTGSLSNYYSPIYQIVTTQYAQDVTQLVASILRYLKSHEMKWDCLTFYPLSGKHLALLGESAKLAGLLCEEEVFTKNWYEQIKGNYQDYLSSIPSKTRNTIKRKTNKLNKAGDCEVKLYSSMENIDEGIAQYQEVYRASWKPEEPYANFVEGFIRMAASKGMLRLGILTLDNEPIAAQFWLCTNDRAYIYKLAYKTQARDLSPGTVLTAKMFEHVIDIDKVSYVDFLTGKDAFKREWMTSQADLFSIKLFNARQPISLMYYVKHQLSKLRSKTGISGIKK